MDAQDDRELGGRDLEGKLTIDLAAKTLVTMLIQGTVFLTVDTPIFPALFPLAACRCDNRGVGVRVPGKELSPRREIP